MPTGRVLIDRQIFDLQRSGGISRYFAELSEQLSATTDWEVELDVRRTTNRHLAASRLAKGFPFAASTRFSEQIRRINRRLTPTIGDSWRKADAIHHTYYDPEILKLTPGACRVTTVHDMTPEAHPQWFPAGNPHRGKREHVRAADSLICVSEATRDQLLAQWGSFAQPIHVVPLGVHPRFSGPAAGYSGDVPYLLFVGSRTGYKDFATLLAAVAQLPSRLSDTRLLCVGGGRFTRSELEAQGQLGLTERVTQCDATDSELVRLYRGAAAFVFPSHSEGFGLPTLEALASGTPTVLSDIPVFREVADTAGYFFEPGDAADLSDTLGLVLTQTRNPVAVLGRQRAADFTWATTAKATAGAYDDAVAYARSHG